MTRRDVLTSASAREKPAAPLAPDVEHALLTPRRMRSSRALHAAVALALGLLAGPSSALALAPQVGAFGPTDGNHSAGNTDLVMYPIAASDCDTMITLSFSGLTTGTTARYIDI